jgi:hypothetical protein
VYLWTSPYFTNRNEGKKNSLASAFFVVVFQGTINPCLYRFLLTAANEVVTLAVLKNTTKGSWCILQLFHILIFLSTPFGRKEDKGYDQTIRFIPWTNDWLLRYTNLNRFRLHRALGFGRTRHRCNHHIFQVDRQNPLEKIHSSYS